MSPEKKGATRNFYITDENYYILGKVAGLAHIYAKRGAGAGKIGSVSGILEVIAQATRKDPIEVVDILLRLKALGEGTLQIERNDTPQPDVPLVSHTPEPEQKCVKCGAKFTQLWKLGEHYFQFQDPEHGLFLVCRRCATRADMLDT